MNLIADALLAAGAACAQAPAAPLVREPLDPRQNQKVERITHEDAGARIDEVRYGGQTQSITVQPKADMPAYEIQPANPARLTPADPRQDAAGQRRWNVLRF